MAITQINPTRMELSRLKKKLGTARRGHKLLKDKRDELMRRFLALVDEDKKLRSFVEDSLAKSNKMFALASAQIGEKEVKSAFLIPGQKTELDVKFENITGVTVPKFNRKEGDGKNVPTYGFIDTSYELDEAVSELSKVFSDMLELAGKEKACMMLASEIEKTRRRVNALEHVLIPQYEEKIRYIKMKLDENERSTQIRLIKVKDMIVAEAIASRQDRA